MDVEKKVVWAVIRTRRAGLHHYPEAQGTHGYLKHPHRHEFHITLWVQQHHDNRDVEYMLAKDELETFLNSKEKDLGFYSCEMFAFDIATFAYKTWGKGRRYRCEVSEDGENGAVVEVQ